MDTQPWPRGLSPAVCGANATPPEKMTANERLDEVARILAAGILRARQQRLEKHAKATAGNREVSLDFSARQRGSDRTKNRRGDKT